MTNPRGNLIRSICHLSSVICHWSFRGPGGLGSRRSEREVVQYKKLLTLPRPCLCPGTPLVCDPLRAKFTSRALVFDHLVQYVVERVRVAVVHEISHLGNVRNAPLHVFEPFLISALVGNVSDRGGASRELLDTAGQIVDRNLAFAADVEDFTDSLRFVDQGHHAADHIADIGEIARLRAVSVDRDGLVAQSLADKARDDHTVAAGLARTDGVEKARHSNRKPLYLPVGEAQELIEGF